MSAELQAIRLIGGVLPAALLTRIQTGELTDMASLSSASYFLGGQEQPRDAAARAWSYLRGAWQTWREADAASDQSAPGTGLARDKWLLILLNELGYGRVSTSVAGRIDTTEYPISHRWNNVPIHLLGPRVDLDRRNKGILGAARAPQSMLQEFLNRSEDDLWGLLSNGVRLRLLRDSTALAGSAYVEFDLESIFDGDLYAEFLLLWHLVHVSRLAKRGQGEDGPENCWLEAWRSDAVTAGARALEHLRAGVEGAITALGTGFLAHRDNGWLRHALYSGELSDRDLHKQLLRLIYRLLFVFVAEDRGALLDPAATTLAQTRYRDYFSTSRLRALTRSVAGGQHPDLWRAQRMILAALGGQGLPAVAIPPLSGLFDPDGRSPLVTGVPEVAGVRGRDLLLSADLSNDHFLRAVRHLSWIKPPGERVQAVDYRHLGAEELGGVYESLLELVPRVDLEARAFSLVLLSGNERKTTGSYYTPPSLVSALLDSALDPVLNEAVSGGSTAQEKERNLLSLTVCDPASGSGGFLVAAARRIARRLAQVRSGEDEPTPSEVQHALHDVVGRCIYGVDMNDLAAELAKVSLWLEALQPGKPLDFLDARIRVGNSLFGATPALLEAGVPDLAFTQIEGDDKKIATLVRKRNHIESLGQSLLTWTSGKQFLKENRELRRGVLAPLNDVDSTRSATRTWREYLESPARLALKRQADAWAAAFVWPLWDGAVLPPTSQVMQALADPDAASHYRETCNEIERLAQEYRFFHWHLEFPEIFENIGGPDAGPDGWSGGFACLLGNPPWEHIELKEQEFFAARDPGIAHASGASRKALIAALPSSDPRLDAQYKAEKRYVDGFRHFASSGRFPLTGRGRVKTDPIFAELFRGLTAPHGSTGVIVPTGIATDATMQHFFNDLSKNENIVSLFDFENRKQGGGKFFDAVDSRIKFCLLALSGRARRIRAADYAFFLEDVSQVVDHRFRLTPEELELLSPNTGTLPVFRSRRAAELALSVYRQVPVLVNRRDAAGGNPWGVSFMQGLFNMTSDSAEFTTRAELEARGWNLEGNLFEIDTVSAIPKRAYDDSANTLALPPQLYATANADEQKRGDDRRMLPLYEGRMGHQFNHRFSNSVASGPVTAAQLNDPNFRVLPEYWVAAHTVDERLRRRTWGTSAALLGHRRVARDTDERTQIATLLPWGAASYGWILSAGPDARGLLQLCAVYNSFIYDFLLRSSLSQPSVPQSTSEQVPVPPPATMHLFSKQHFEGKADFLIPRALELTYTSWDMKGVAEAVEDFGPPFQFDRERRAFIRAEIDAFCFRIYGLDRDDVSFVMDSFAIIRKREVALHGEFLTKRRVLECFDEMQQSADAGRTFASRLRPAPGFGTRHNKDDNDA